MSGEIGWRAGLCAGLCAGLVMLAWPAVSLANSALADRLDNPLAVPRLTDAVPEPASPCAAPPTVDSPHAPRPLTLAQAMQTALCLNPQARAAGAAIRVQASAVGEARAAYLPRVSIGLNRLSSRTAYADGGLPEDDRVGTNRSVNLTWRLYDFGARSAGLDVVHQLLRAATATRDATLQKLLAAVVDTYFDAVTTQATQGARAEAVRLARSTLQATERREALGAAAGSDVLQARAARARAQLAAQRAQGERAKAASVLAYVMGLPGTAPLTLPEGLDAPEGPAVDDLAHWLAEAQAGHPGIRAAQAQREAALAKVSAVRAEGWPSLEFSRATQVNGVPSQGFGTSRSRTATYGLALSIPLFEGFARVYKVSGAQAQAEQSDASLQNLSLIHI